MPVDWSAIDKLDKERMMKLVLSPIEAPGDFHTNLLHFAHGSTHFVCVLIPILTLFFLTLRLTQKPSIIE